MRKFMIFVILVLGTWAAAAYLYRGKVPAGQLAVLVEQVDGVTTTRPVNGLVFSLSKGSLRTYSSSPYYFRLAGTDMLKVRTVDGVDVGLEVGMGLKFDQAGVGRYSTAFDRPVKETVNQEIHARLTLVAGQVVAALSLDRLTSRMDSICGVIRAQAAPEVDRIGFAITALDVLAPPILPERVQQLLQASFTTERELRLAEHYFNTAALLEEATMARSRALQDSATTHDKVSRMDTARAHEHAVRRYRTDSTLFALKYTRGFLENKRLEVIAKAVEKWDGRLAGKRFASPFDELGREPDQPKEQQTDKLP